MNRKIDYRYSLSPFLESKTTNDSVEIDLNQSSDFDILFAAEERNTKNDDDSREFQINRLVFLKEHTKELNIIANTTRQLCLISDITFEDIELMMVYSKIINGDYGQEPVEFFTNEENSSIIEIILYYLVCKNHNNKREYYFKSVLKEVFNDKVYFYFDKMGKKLYVTFVTEETKFNISIFNVCKYFFADILLDIEVRWRIYPAVLDKTNYVIASEGEQLCGTII